MREDEIAALPTEEERRREVGLTGFHGSLAAGLPCP